MDLKAVTDSVIAFSQSGVGFAVIWAMMVALFVWLTSKFNPFQEQWKAWEGSIVTGIKLAEKQIPDDTPNAGLQRLDAALRFVLGAYAEANHGKQPSAKLSQQIKQGIQIKHAELDRLGGLRG